MTLARTKEAEHKRISHYRWPSPNDGFSEKWLRVGRWICTDEDIKDNYQLRAGLRAAIECSSGETCCWIGEDGLGNKIAVGLYPYQDLKRGYKHGVNTLFEINVMDHFDFPPREEMPRFKSGTCAAIIDTDPKMMEMKDPSYGEVLHLLDLDAVADIFKMIVLAAKAGIPDKQIKQACMDATAKINSEQEAPAFLTPEEIVNFKRTLSANLAGCQFYVG